MRLRSSAVAAALAVAAFASPGCVLIPEIEERVVEIAVAGSAAAGFDAAGDVNVHEEVAAIDVSTQLDLEGVLADAGIDLASVRDIKVSGVSCRVTRLDPDPGRALQDGTVSVQRVGATGETGLIGDLDLPVNFATEWRPVAVQAAGVIVLNDLLSDLLASEQNGTPIFNPIVALHVVAPTYPQGVPSDFAWELRLSISILGEVRVDVPN